MRTALQKIILAAVLLALLFSTACSSSPYKDGVYHAELSEYENGWKDMVDLTIEGGEITKITWDSVYKDDSIPIRKKQYSKSGLYGMLRAGAQDEWYDQTLAAEQYVIQNGVDSYTVDSEGYTDSITGCTIHVNGFDKLVRECLKQAKR